MLIGSVSGRKSTPIKKAPVDSQTLSTLTRTLSIKVVTGLESIHFFCSVLKCPKLRYLSITSNPNQAHELIFFYPSVAYFKLKNRGQNLKKLSTIKFSQLCSATRLVLTAPQSGGRGYGVPARLWCFDF